MVSKMQISRFSVTSVVLSAFTLVQGATADVINLRADQWCPFNCDPDSERPGYMVEIAQEALALYGHEVSYKTMSWSRSLDLVRSGGIDGVIGTDQSESPTLVFGTSIAQYQEAAAFRVGETRPIESEVSLEGLRLGGIQDYDYSEFLLEYIENNSSDPTRIQLLTGDNALERNLRKLQANRIDLLLEERSVLAYSVSRMQLEAQLELSFVGDMSELYIAFSPALETSTTYAQQLSEGYQRLQESGRVAEILAKYGLTG